MKTHYITKDGNQLGPYSIDEIKEKIASGDLTEDDLCWSQGMTEWVSIHTVLSPGANMPPPPPMAQELMSSIAGTVQGKNGAPIPAAEKGASLVGNAWTRVSGGVSNAAGLEKLEGQGARNLFGALFGKRTIEELEDSFAVGTCQTTPQLKDVSTDWPAPWVFMRLLTFTIIVTIGFYWAIQRFDNIKLYPGWLFMGAFAVPVSVMFFFIETNVLRNISLYRVLKLLFYGGLISLIVALILFEVTAATDWFGAMAAGPVEELAKLLAVVFIAKRWQNMHWTLNGMLLGAAVGAGFAAFETAGYIFEFAIHGGNDIAIMLMRAMTSPFTHIIWTAITVGALWRFKGKRNFEFGMLKEWPVLRILLFVMALHAIWNSPLIVPIVGDFLGLVLKYLILGGIGWLLVLLLIQSGLSQVGSAKIEDGECDNSL